MKQPVPSKPMLMYAVYAPFRSSFLPSFLPSPPRRFSRSSFSHSLLFLFPRRYHLSAPLPAASLSHLQRDARATRSRGNETFPTFCAKVQSDASCDPRRNRRDRRSFDRCWPSDLLVGSHVAFTPNKRFLTAGAIDRASAFNFDRWLHGRLWYFCFLSRKIVIY